MNINSRTAKVVALISAVVILAILPPVGLSQSQTRTALTFTCIAKPETPDEPETFRAVIFVMAGNAWRRIDLPERYESASWEYAARAKNKRDVWAIAQFGRGDIGPDLEIAHSPADGRTWRHRSLTKISRFAGFESFSMAQNGRGSLTIRLQDSPDAEHQDGYYTYETRNNGRTWSSKPRFSKTAPPAAPTILEPIGISSAPCLKPSEKPPSTN